MQSVIKPYEKFLRLDDRLSALDKTRARAVYVVGWAFILIQILNLFFMTATYKSWTLDHSISIIAIFAIFIAIHTIRFYKNYTVYALFLSALIFGSIYFSASVDNTGIHSALIPFLIIGPMMCSFISGWRMAIAFAIFGLGFLVLLYIMSADADFGPSTELFFYEARSIQRALQSAFGLILMTVIASMVSANIAHALNSMEESIKIADEANLAKTTFLKNMSQELQTPLHDTLTLSDLILQTEPTTRQSDLINMIKKSSGGVHIVISDILDFANLEANRVKIKQDSFNLISIIEQLFKFYTPVADRKNLKIHLDLKRHLPDNYIGDAERVRQILGNLINNAIKFTDKGTITMRLKGQPTIDNLETMALRFEVIDTGRGVPQNMYETIFEGFAHGQLDPATLESKGHGTGLGLSIAKELVEKMNGKIGIQSNVGTGSTFWFTLNLPINPDMSVNKQWHNFGTR